MSDIREQNCKVDGSAPALWPSENSMTFTVVEQDETAVRVIAHWIYLNIEKASPEKLRLALEECLEMRKFPNRKTAD